MLHANTPLRISLILLLLLLLSSSEACHLRKDARWQSPVCVCNSSKCDEFHVQSLAESNSALLIQSSRAGKRYDQKKIEFRAPTRVQSGDPPLTVSIDARLQFQEVTGFGSSITDSAVYVLRGLSVQVQDLLLKSYFGDAGNDYDTVRTPIASTDFSRTIYSYDDEVGDLELKKFNLSEQDYLYKIPLIRKIQNELRNGRPLRLIASPWSPPGWMKDTGRMPGGGQLKRSKNQTYERAYANYLLRFFEAYKTQGNITFYALTTQNEPSSGALPAYRWQTMLFTATSQRDFIRDHFGPVCRQSEACRNVKLLILDDNIIHLPSWADVVMADKDAARYVGGVAIHWYAHDSIPLISRKLIALTSKKYPHLPIINTEACNGYNSGLHVDLGSWERAAKYTHDIIQDMLRGVSGWIDWNMCLDETGGPTWVPNYVDSPIIVNATANEFYRQPTYYALGHFSKLIKPGMRRVFTSTAGAESGDIEFETIGFANSTHTVLVVHSRKETPQTISILDKTRNRQLTVDIDAESISTLVWRT